jgi:hypothetical protein
VAQAPTVPVQAVQQPARQEQVAQAPEPAQVAQPQSAPVQVVQPRIVPALQEQSASLPVAATPVGWQPEELVVRSRPSGMPGSLLLGGYTVPVRRVE